MSKQRKSKVKPKVSKREVSFLELARKNVLPKQNKKLSNTVFKNLKKGLKGMSYKKATWKILKIITKDGVYTPPRGHEVYLVGPARKNKKNEQVTLPKAK